jgi:hypothetical protein
VAAPIHAAAAGDHDETGALPTDRALISEPTAGRRQ